MQTNIVFMTVPVKSVSQSLSILRVLAQRNPLSLSEIVRMLELSPSSCLNLLKTLVGEGVIERDLRTKKYRLTHIWSGTEALKSGAEQTFVDRAVPLMHKFSQAADVAVGLWKVFSAERMRLVSHTESDAGMRLKLADAQRQPLGAGAAGRALASAQAIDATEMRRRFAAVRWQSDLSFEDYEQQVHIANKKGYAIDLGAAHRGVWTIAVPVTAVAPGFCLSASMLAGSRSDAAIDELGGELLKLRHAITSGK